MHDLRWKLFTSAITTRNNERIQTNKQEAERKIITEEKVERWKIYWNTWIDYKLAMWSGPGSPYCQRPRAYVYNCKLSTQTHSFVYTPRIQPEWPGLKRLMLNYIVWVCANFGVFIYTFTLAWLGSVWFYCAVLAFVSVHTQAPRFQTHSILKWMKMAMAMTNVPRGEGERTERLVDGKCVVFSMWVEMYFHEHSMRAESLQKQLKL